MSLNSLRNTTAAFCVCLLSWKRQKPGDVKSRVMKLREFEGVGPKFILWGSILSPLLSLLPLHLDILDD